MTVNACEFEAGKDKGVYLAINSGTDLALFNAWLHPHRRERLGRQGLHCCFDQGFRQGGRCQQDQPGGCRNHRSERRRHSQISRVDRASEGRLRPSKDNVRLREGVDLYDTINHWRPGERRARDRKYLDAQAAAACVWADNGEEGYVRPDYPGGRPAPYIDQLIIEGKGGAHHIWACDHYKTTLNA